MEDDIIKEKEGLIKGLRMERAQLEKDELTGFWLSIWKVLGPLMFITVLGISIYSASQFSGRSILLVFFMTWFGIFLPIIFIFYLIMLPFRRRKDRRVKVLDRRIEDSRFYLARIK